MYEIIIGCLIIFGIGGLMVYRVYRHRTREPDLSGLTDMIGMDLPDGVNLEDALGRLK